jgi:predicted chitinase
LGNTEPGDGARYKGRGYLLLTGKRNYAKANQLLGLAGTDSDLLKNPDKALDPEIAIESLASSCIRSSDWEKASGLHQ